MNAMADLLNQLAAEYWVWLKHASWQVAVVGLVLWGLVSVGAKWRAPWRYALLLIAVIKFAVPPFFPVGSGVLSGVAVAGMGVREGTSGTDWTEGTKEGAPALISGAGGKGEGEVVLAARMEAPEWEVPVGRGSAPVGRGSVLLQWQAWVLVLHLAGAVAVAGWVMRQLAVLRRWVRESRPVEDPRVARLLDDLVRQLELRQVPVLRVSREVPAPIAFGLWRPTILLPADSLARLPESEWRGVLGHELAHFRRGDLWVNWFQVLLQVIWWFHPVLWLVNRALRRVREDCCDDLVLAQRVSTRERYGEVLVRAASVFANPGAVTGTLGFGEDLHPLGRRLVRIMDPTIVRAPRLSMAGMAAAVVMAAVMLPGVRLESAGQAQGSQPGQLAQVKDAELVPYQSGRPKLIAVAPGNGATEVSPDTRIRLRFDRPMDSNRMELEWQTGGIYSRGEPEYLEATHEFVLPVHLVPGVRHSVRVNANPGAGEPNGFQSRDGVAAEPATVEFTTAKGVVQGPEPKVVKMVPASGAKVGCLTVIRLEFDQVMDPDRYEGIVEPEAKTGFAMAWSRVKPLALIEWEAEFRVVRVPVVLPPNWNGTFELRGFCSARGETSAPVVVSYSTGTELWSADDLNRRNVVTGTPEVREIVGLTKAGRRSLTSLSESVRQVQWSAVFRGGRSAFGLKAFTFKMQGDRQFFGDVQHIMGIPFAVGSDGTHCWFQALRTGENGESRLVLKQCGFEEIGEKDLSFADPFPSAEGIEYLGKGELRGRTCHRLRSWAVHAVDMGPERKDIWANVRTWWVDAQEHRLILLEDHSNFGGSETWFIADRVNERIPDREFQPSAGPNVVVEPVDPLTEGYTVRTLKVRDGSDGRMGLRWGMQGPKGSMSSGLN